MQSLLGHGGFANCHHSWRARALGEQRHALNRSTCRTSLLGVPTIRIILFWGYIQGTPLKVPRSTAVATIETCLQLGLRHFLRGQGSRSNEKGASRVQVCPRKSGFGCFRRVLMATALWTMRFGILCMQQLQVKVTGSVEKALQKPEFRTGLHCRLSCL